ncbi:hypothetical protein J421_4335 [Gemmatirosa kalamazoonensis]|uniref:Lipoprotein n=2 Tax=Gemmatirosa kalamazoonensis TaxID=861299 RepID=W0RN06_9BACT|nr:hypothetical protein J421_4335 [Gemmatirosa kalamazoonensis]
MLRVLSPPKVRRAASLLALGLAAVLAGCRGRAASTAGARPAAEFLLSAGDSTYWITSDPARVRVRSSAMFLARYGGHLYEVYAADDDRSYYDAIFTSQRIFSRDLVGGDSTTVFSDPLVPTLARRYATSHPHELPLGPEDEGAEDPRTQATTEVSLVDLHGPFLTYDARADIDVDGGTTRHTARRTVVDLRSARTMSVAELFGTAAAESLVVEGRRRLARALDSVRTLADTDDETEVRALHALSTFRFQADNFGLAAVGARPAVSFVALGRDADGHAVTLVLSPIVVPGAAPAWWSADVSDALPTVAADSSELRWRVHAAEVLARPVRGQDAATLTVRAANAARRRTEYPLGRVPMPVHQLFALDRPALDAVSRRALVRAFNESALYGDQAISAAYRSGERGAWRVVRGETRRRATLHVPRTTLHGSR